MGVLDIHHFIADVVGGFNDVNQRMTRIAQRFPVGGETFYAEFGGYAHVVVLLGGEEAEFTF